MQNAKFYPFRLTPRQHGRRQGRGRRRRRLVRAGRGSEGGGQKQAFDEQRMIHDGERLAGEGLGRGRDSANAFNQSPIRPANMDGLGILESPLIRYQ